MLSNVIRRRNLLCFLSLLFVLSSCGNRNEGLFAQAEDANGYVGPTIDNPIGNYRLIYSDINLQTDRFTIDSFDFVDVSTTTHYSGFSANDSSIAVDISIQESNSNLALIAPWPIPETGSYKMYGFQIMGDGTLSGCYYSITVGVYGTFECTPLESGSMAYPAGKWQKPTLDMSDPSQE